MRARWIVGVSIASFYLAAAGCSGSSKINGAGAGSSTVDPSSGAASGSTAIAGSAGFTATPAGGGSSGTGFDPIITDSGVSDGATDTDAAPSGDVCGTTCPAGGSCSPETCDGVDNNCDGVIDNVDKNSDGICDCLLIATLGDPGTWGQGDVFSAWLGARSNTGAAALMDQTLTPELLAKYEVIVAQDVHLNHVYSDAEVQALQAWVQAGGGFMTLIGYAKTGEVTNVNRLLAPFSMSYADKQILPKRGGSTVPITEWVPHPIDQGVTAVGVDEGCPVQGMGTVIATADGNDVGLAQQVSAGHVFMWGDEWITYNSEWVQHTDYQIELFWVNSIKWLTTASKCQVPIPPVIPK
jgi:hypothetical protein